jgi:hypothetical protein
VLQMRSAVYNEKYDDEKLSLVRVRQATPSRTLAMVFVTRATMYALAGATPLHAFFT